MEMKQMADTKIHFNRPTHKGHAEIQLLNLTKQN